MRMGGLLMLAAIFFATSCQSIQPPTPPPVRIEPYVFRSYDGQELPAEIGRFVVPANRRHRSDRTLTLAYVKLAATAPQPGPPIVFLAGGPGIPGVGIAQVPVYAALFRRLRAVSDVILLDQRGVGLSEPNLSCERQPLAPVRWEDEAALERGLVEALTRCVAASRARGVEPADFNSEEAARDVEDLRVVLGVPRLNLLAWSYGTEVALAALRSNPRSYDRVVLSGVRPPGRLLKSPSDWEAQFQRLSALAARDPAAVALTPDLYAAAVRQVEALRRRPVALAVRDWVSGQEVTLNAGGLALQLVIRLDLSDLRAAGRLPALIGSLERGDTSLFRARMEQAYNGLTPALTLAIDCASGWSPERRRLVDAEASMSLFRPVNIQWSPASCAASGARDLGEGFRRPIRSRAVTLFISGTLDPNTPAAQAEWVRRGFPHGTHVIFENGGHELLPAEEVQALIVRMFSGEPVESGTIALSAPTFATIEDARRAFQPPQRR